jgi:cell division protease FtsH
MPEPEKRAQVPDKSQQSHPPRWRVEGSRKAPEPDQGHAPRSPQFKTIAWIVAVLLAINIAAAAVASHNTSRPTVPYTFFRQQVFDNNISDVSSRGDVIQGDFRTPVLYPARTGSLTTRFKSVQPSFATDDQELLNQLVADHVQINAHSIDQATPFWEAFLIGLAPLVLFVGIGIWLSRRMMRLGGGLSTFGRAKANRYVPPARRTTFNDVAGIDEAKDELAEIVDFLKNPERYARLGGEIPRGVLLSGLPGTGKTLLARAVAGEANVPFFSMSASEFVEMIVGVGASRARDLFAQAKQEAPAIIFIDELDAIGRRRGVATGFGGHDEREQTLNQILTEMDGFSGHEGVIVLAATNRAEVLDPALLRPGRFDRRVVVNPPDQAGRAAILRVHTRFVPVAPHVDLEAIAATTPGMVGADLKNLVNEAALLAARRGHQQVQAADFNDALERVVLGAERRITVSPAERERTAYHEAGHALLGMLQPGADPVRKVSIVPRGRALGVTFQTPDADRYGYDAEYLRGRIVGALGGRAAEQIVFGTVTSGAESDLEQVTLIARQMVGRWGMSDAVGPVSVLPHPEDEGIVLPAGGGASEATLQLVDDEVRRIVDECSLVALSRLRDNRHRLDALAHKLLKHETLDAASAYQAAGFPVPRRPGADILGQGDGYAAA